jgi:hypothetical protein
MLTIRLCIDGFYAFLRYCSKAFALAYSKIRVVTTRPYARLGLTEYLVTVIHRLRDGSAELFLLFWAGSGDPVAKHRCEVAILSRSLCLSHLIGGTRAPWRWLLLPGCDEAMVDFYAR